MSLIRVSDETKSRIDAMRLANNISAGQVISKLIGDEPLTTPPANGPPANGLSPNDEYRIQCIEAFFSNSKVDLDKELQKYEAKNTSI